MNILLFNTRWMLWNIFLAATSIILGRFSLKTKPKILQALTLLIFLLFIPNTIYIATDLGHLFQQWGRVFSWYKILLVLQYVIVTPIGFITFIYSMKLLAKNLVRFNIKLRSNLVMILMNFIVAFGVVIGRIQRANSWEVITNPLKIFQNFLATLISFNLIVYILMLGLFCNILYFAVRDAGVGERT